MIDDLREMIVCVALISPQISVLYREPSVKKNNDGLEYRAQVDIVTVLKSNGKQPAT
jgi:hypothetical protein